MPPWTTSGPSEAHRTLAQGGSGANRKGKTKTLKSWVPVVPLRVSRFSVARKGGLFQAHFIGPIMVGIIFPSVIGPTTCAYALHEK